MGTYNIPRNVKGEGRILFIFSRKALIYSGIGAAVGAVIYLILVLLGMSLIGLLAVLICAVLGFVIGTFKIPELGSLAFTKKVGGENIDDVIKRAILFKKNGKKIYLYTKDTKEEQK